MIDSLFSGAFGGLIYAFIGRWHSRRTEKFSNVKFITTIILALCLGIMLQLFGLTTGNFIADGFLATGWASALKKFFISLSREIHELWLTGSK